MITKVSLIIQKKLQEEFSELHNYQTNTRGIKVRGTFGFSEEAEAGLKC